MDRDNRLDEILQVNGNFIDSKEYNKVQTTKFPDKRLVILLYGYPAGRPA